jgi:hypothetical protein
MGFGAGARSCRRGSAAVPVIMTGLRIARHDRHRADRGILGPTKAGRHVRNDGLNRFFNTPLLIGGVLTIMLSSCST